MDPVPLDEKKSWWKSGPFRLIALAIVLLVGLLGYNIYTDEVDEFVDRTFHTSPVPAPKGQNEKGGAVGRPAAPAAPAAAPAPVPAADVKPAAAASPANDIKPPPVRTYTMRRGETLSGVFGRVNGVKVCEWNKLTNCNLVMAGQVLKLPDGVTAKARVPKAAKHEVKPEMKSQVKPIIRPHATRMTQEQSCIRLGAHPFNPDFLSGSERSLRRTLQGIDLLTTLNPDQKAKARELVRSGLRPDPTLVGTHVFKEMIFERDKKIVHVYDKRICSVAEGNVPEVMYLYDLGGGVNFALPRRCGNPAVVIIPVPVSVPVEAPPIVVVPPPVVEVPVVPAPPLSVIPKANEVAEWEAIVGVGVWRNNLAAGNWQYAEGMFSKILQDGYRVGVGAYGQWGSGDSKTSPYSWRERAYGPQFGVKRNFLVMQTDQFGQQRPLPAGWGLKLRLLKDYVSGGNPDSGYRMSQTGRKVGLYAEYMERKNPDWMVGVNGEVWNFGSGKITSTWSGDKPQDRGSWNLNAWAQYRHSDDWQTRGIIGVAHQNWDELNLLRVAGELRYQETFMCGPSVSLALNKPATYSTVSKSDLTTLGFSCRAEFGGILRTWDREQREAGVEYVGPAQPPPN